ncbi:PREDICTED: uncharacterized protein LOC109221461 [Nicotiana attenuata]|uniref:uncharacterized protein LOC109221461 n=1 Tax=Nicotiana attenuata TaxID=49451 RepID=UPI00090502E8|nr:PREDICTED: uncharacterized protein LOC109221461 [Nicotiana attenuata]
MQGDYQKVSWIRLVCNNAGSPKWIFILRLIAHGKLYTKDRLAKWGIVNNMICPLCESEDESREHLFFLCKYSESVWSRLLKWQGIRRKHMGWIMEQEWVERYARGKNGSADIYRMTLAACVYAIWQERNLRVFQNKKRDAEWLTRSIVQDVHVRGANKVKIASKLGTMNWYP